MLITAGVYIISLCSVLSDTLIILSLVLSLLFIFLIIKNYLPLKYIVIWLLLFYLGAINLSVRLKDTDELLNLAPVNSEITGTIISIPQGISERKPKFFFKVDKIKFANTEKELSNEKLLVTMNSLEGLSGLKLYNSGVLSGRLSVPFKAGNPSQFDYCNYLRNHNTYAVFYAKKFVLVDKKLGLRAKTLQSINNYREKVLDIHSKYLKSPNLEILGGIVFGDDAVAPPQDIKDSFANSGLLHILAASGMNVAFIYGFFFWIFSLLRINYRVKVLLGMLMVIIYSLMTGLGASIIRATIMLLFVLIGKLIDRDAHSISLLSFVALLMLLYNPLFINDVGFQLSFIVTLGILLMTPVVLRFNNKILDYIGGIVTVPIIAQAWVIPIQIFYFSNICIYSIFANIMSVSLLAIISFGGFVSSLLAVINPFADFICEKFDFVLNPVLTLLVNISDFWGHMPKSAIQTTHPTVFQIVIYYGMLLSITGFMYKGFREKYLRKLVYSFLILIFLLLVTLIPIRNRNLEIITFDVGNADSFLIKTPENKYILLDTGRAGYKGGKSQAEIIVLKYLKDRGIKNLEALIITHFDNDHCGGAVDVVNNLDVKKVYVNSINHESNSAKMLYKAIKKQGVECVLAQNDQTVYEKDALRIINYLGADGLNDNDNSIITFLEKGDFTMLFTGDVSAKGLSSLLNNFPKNITVLKVPHHGAIGGLDDRIVGYLAPKYSIISVGDNKFGHPSIYNLKILKDSQVLRTDVNNSILIRVCNNKIKVLTYNIKKHKYE